MDKFVLSIEASKFLQLKQHLVASFPTADEVTVTDTLEGITDLHEMIAAVIRSALVDEALQVRSPDSPRTHARAAGAVRGARRQEAAIGARSDARGRAQKLEQPDFTASARAGTPYLVVVSEDLIPPSLLDSPAAEARSPVPPG